MKNICSFLFALFLFNALSGQNREINFRNMSWQDILILSKMENKLIMLDAYTSWCGPCKKMAKYIFTNDTVADYYNKTFINVKYDAEKGEGIEIAKKYRVQGYPTFLFIDGNGKLIHRHCGTLDASGFVELGKNATNPDMQLISLKKEFEKDANNSEKAYRYFHAMEIGCADATAEIQFYFSGRKESDLLSYHNWRIFYLFFDEYESREFKYFLTHLDTFSKVFSRDTVEDKLVSMFTRALHKTIVNNDSLKMGNIITELKQTGIKKTDEIIIASYISYHEMNMHWVDYAKYCKIYVENYVSDSDCVKLNDFAWKFYENINDKTMLKIAAAWAEKSIQIKKIYNNHDTYAWILYKLGRINEARAMAQKAIEIGSKNNEDIKGTQDLLALIDALKQ